MSKPMEVGDIVDAGSLAELYPARFLHAEDFRGKQVTLTIKGKPWREGLRGKAAKEVNAKVILAFVETDKQLVLPKINSHALATMFGADINAWAGKRVTFWPTATLLPKDRGVDCIRVFGSPQIERPMSCVFKAPQRGDTVWTLQPTGKKPAPAPAPAPPAVDADGVVADDSEPFDPAAPAAE